MQALQMQLPTSTVFSIQKYVWEIWEAGSLLGSLQKHWSQTWEVHQIEQNTAADKQVDNSM